MPGRMSAIVEVAPQLIATATLRVDTPGAGFTEITANAAGFIEQISAGEGALLVYLRHTSASLAIQENADPDVQPDLIAALDRLAPENAPWIHDVEGPDDMPAHVKAMLNGVFTARTGHRRQTGARCLAGHLSRSSIGAGHTTARLFSSSSAAGSEARMIPKSGNRFSEQIMRQEKTPRSAGRFRRGMAGGEYFAAGR